MITTVVNKRTYKGPGVYIGRPGPWGNDFSHVEGTKATHFVASRDGAVQAHRVWLWQQIQAGHVTLEDLAALHGQTLICWCKPQACHGDTLAAAAAWASTQLKEAR